MSYSFPLERAFLASEYGREAPSKIRIVGTLLDSAFQNPSHDRDLERLCAMLDERPVGRKTLH